MNYNLREIKIDGTTYKLSSPKETRNEMRKNGKMKTMNKYHNENDTIWIDTDFFARTAPEDGNKTEDSSVSKDFSEGHRSRSGYPLTYRGYQISDSSNPPERVSPLVMNIIPNPHLDKDLLTVNELIEVLAWAAEQSGNIFEPDAVNYTIESSPNSIATKLIDFLGQFVYGENNFIGPDKTGNIGTTTLLNAVTTVPALSDADARARAHDIALSITQSPKVDEILPPLAQTAQLLRPITGYGAPSRGATNFDLLKQAGDVESNPGPKIEIDEAAASLNAQDMENPCSTNNYNLVNADVYDTMYAELSKRTSLMARAAIDNQSDTMKVDDGIWSYCGYSQIDVPTLGNRRTTRGSRLHHYAVINQDVKEKMKLGTVGTNLNTSLAGFSEFLALQRTNNNVVQGSSDVQIFSRTPGVDYGCWLAAAKMLSYECCSGPLSGSLDNSWRLDGFMRYDPVGPNIAPNNVYPLTLNANFAAGFPINCVAITSEVQAKYLMNEITPANIGPFPDIDSPAVAAVVVPGSMSPDAITYYIMCHLEYPFVDNNRTVQGVGLAGAAEPVIRQSATVPADHRGMHYIAGPRDLVVIVLPSRTDQATINVGGVAVNIWSNPAAVCPALVDVSVPLFTYAANFSSTPGRFTPAFREAFTHAARFMDINDWRAAVHFAAGLVFSIGGLPSLSHGATLAGSGRIITNAVSAPTIGAIGTASWDLVAGNTTIVTDFMDRYPTWSSNGTVSSFSVPGLGARPPVPVTAFVNDTPWLTKLGIFRNFYAKSTISRSKIDDLFKGDLLPLFMMIRRVALRNAQMMHGFFQDMGVTNRMVFSRAPAVADRFTAIWDDFFNGLSFYQEALVGYVFYRPVYPQIPVIATPGAGNVAIPYVGDTPDWWYDSPVYLYNHLENILDPTETLYYPKPAVALRLDGVCKSVVASPTVVANIYGIPTGGGTSIRTEPTLTNDSFTMKDDVRKMFALSRYTVLHNATPYDILYNIFQTQHTQTIPLHYRTKICGSLTWILRWATATNLTTGVRALARYVIATLPFYPPSYDPTSGLSLDVVIQSVGVYQAMRQSVGYDGLGSASYLTLPLQVPVYNKFADRRAALAAKKNAGGEGPPPGVKEN